MCDISCKKVYDFECEVNGGSRSIKKRGACLCEISKLIDFALKLTLEKVKFGPNREGHVPLHRCTESTPVSHTAFSS